MNGRSKRSMPLLVSAPVVIKPWLSKSGPPPVLGLNSRDSGLDTRDLSSAMANSSVWEEISVNAPPRSLRWSKDEDDEIKLGQISALEVVLKEI